MTTNNVTATLTQLATGLPVEEDTCTMCDRPLRAGTPVIVTLTRQGTRPVWTVATCRCRECLRSQTSQSSYVLTATLSVCSHAHAQTHALCLAEPEPLTTAAIESK